MKIQMAYKFTGEDSVKLIEELKKIVSIFEGNGHLVYCPVLNPDRPKDKKALFFDTLKRLEDTDAIFALIKSDTRSEGMLMEIGHAWGMGKKLIVAINKGVENTHFREFADVVIDFENMEELYEKLEGVR